MHAVQSQVVSLFIANAAACVDAVERALVAQATARRDNGTAIEADQLEAVTAAMVTAVGASGAGGAGERDAINVCATAAMHAIAARYLAIGTPRTIGLVLGDSAATALARSDIAHAFVAALRVFFASGQWRFACADDPTLAAACCNAFGGDAARDALGADIVCYSRGAAPLSTRLRRGSHHNLATLAQLPACDPSWLSATLSLSRQLPIGASPSDSPGGQELASTSLPRLAAGLDDGRQLDEVTVFVVG